MDDRKKAFQQGVIPSSPERAHKKHSLCEHSLVVNIAYVNKSVIPFCLQSVSNFDSTTNVFMHHIYGLLTTKAPLMFFPPKGSPVHMDPTLGKVKQMDNIVCILDS